MSDLGSYRVPREAPVGREVVLEQRRLANRTAIFAVGGVLLLCVCLALGLCGLSFGMGVGPFAGNENAFSLNLPFGSSPTPTRAATSGSSGATAYGKSAKNDAGLSVTVAGFQRPLPTQDVEIPDDQELALVSIRLQNTRTTGGNVKFDPSEFALVSPEGDRFEPNIGGITTGENLKPGELGPGKNLKGDLIFYVYQDVPDLQLAWTSADGKTRLFKLTR